MQVHYCLFRVRIIGESGYPEDVEPITSSVNLVALRVNDDATLREQLSQATDQAIRAMINDGVLGNDDALRVDYAPIYLTDYLTQSMIASDEARAMEALNDAQDAPDAFGGWVDDMDEVIGIVTHAPE